VGPIDQPHIRRLQVGPACKGLPEKEKGLESYWAGSKLAAQQGSAHTGGRLGLRLAGRLWQRLGCDGLARRRLDELGLIGQWRPKPSFSFSFLSLFFCLFWLTGLARPSASLVLHPLLSSPACFLPWRTVLASRRRRRRRRTPVAAWLRIRVGVLAKRSFSSGSGINKLSVARSWCGEARLGRHC
jgi:hypothetical protein